MTADERRAYEAQKNRPWCLGASFALRHPACWYWPAADFETWRPAYEGIPLPLVGEARRHPIITSLPAPKDATRFLHKWQAGRCALCGFGRGDLVEDHDHVTGYTRGLLCHRCNTREGAGRDRNIDEYRQLYPTRILGLRIIYTDWMGQAPERVPARCITWQALGGGWAPENNATMGIGL